MRGSLLFHWLYLKQDELCTFPKEIKVTVLFERPTASGIINSELINVVYSIKEVSCKIVVGIFYLNCPSSSK